MCFAVSGCCPVGLFSVEAAAQAKVNTNNNNNLQKGMIACWAEIADHCMILSSCSWQLSGLC